MAKEETSLTDSCRYATFGARLLALLLDGIVLNAATSILFLVFGRRYGIFNLETATDPLNFGGSVQTSAVTLIQWLYNILMLKYYGATLGKMALRIKVVGDGKELDWVTIILRETIGKFVSGIILGIGYLMVAWDIKKQGLHDKIAGTFVVKES